MSEKHKVIAENKFPKESSLVKINKEPLRI
jgi:hypothetical protein